MELKQYTKRLLAELEDDIGGETYNPNSYNGWTGDEGCAFRYPISIPCGETNTMIKVRNWDDYLRLINSDDVSVEQLREIRYKFGSNELYIGRGLLNVLTHLEIRYGLDFDKLERKYREDHASQNFYDEKDCDMNKKMKKGVICIRKFSQEDKYYSSPKDQLVLIDIASSIDYFVLTCASDRFVTLKPHELIGVASKEVIKNWHERFGDFPYGVEREIKRTKEKLKTPEEIEDAIRNQYFVRDSARDGVVTYGVEIGDDDEIKINYDVDDECKSFEKNVTNEAFFKALGIHNWDHFVNWDYSDFLASKEGKKLLKDLTNQVNEYIADEYNLLSYKRY